MRTVLFKAPMPTLLVAMLIAFPAAAMAASFDCGKASTVTEKLICADPALSRLDEQLAIAYRNALKNNRYPGGLKDRQKSWLDDIRRSCHDATCLKKAYERRIAELSATSGETVERCTVAPDIVMGSWRQLDGGDFEEFALELHGGKRQFTSWRHHRPELIATWRLEGCKLSLTDGPSSRLDFVYEVLQSRKNLLRLKDPRDGTVSSYTRVKN